MKKTQAFTLLELIIAVAIVGILAAVAYPNYQSSIQKSHRADGKAALLNLANIMERYYTEKATYCDAADSTTGNAVTNCGGAGNDTGKPAIYSTPAETAAYYTIAINAASPNTYTLSATPTGAQSTDSCSTLTLTSTGVKSPTTAGCW